MNLHSGDTASLTSTNDDGTTSDFTMTVVIHPNARPTGEFTTPAEKGQYVVADVTIKVTSGSYSYNPFDFQEQSGNGQIWQPTFAIGFDRRLMPAPLQQGIRRAATSSSMFRAGQSRFSSPAALGSQRRQPGTASQPAWAT
jgi:hypothetical protein